MNPQPAPAAFLMLASLWLGLAAAVFLLLFFGILVLAFAWTCRC